MASFGLFGSAAPRIRRLTPADMDPLIYAPQLAPAEGVQRPKSTALSMVGATNPAPPPAMGLFGTGVPKVAAPARAKTTGYTPGKRDWLGEIGSDPLGFLLTGTNGLSQKRAEAMGHEQTQSALDSLNLSPEERVRAQMDPEGFFRGLNDVNTAQMKPQTDTFYDPETRQWMRKPLGPVSVADGADLVDPETRQPIYSNEKSDQTADIRQVGNQIVERQQDGSWKPVYTGSNAEETARAFQGFIDADTGDQMVVMSNGQARSTGHKAYIPAQITDMGGVPTAVDKRTLGTTQLSPLPAVAGNKAAIASAEVQGKAQGQAAFDLPSVELRSQSAINSIGSLRGQNLDTRFGMQGKLYAIPGTEGADVQARINQVTSQAFLNAFDQLKGAGAITETEGKAATAAITRLQNQNITVGEALKAMDELEQYYKNGLAVARQKATKAPVLPNMPAGAQGAPQGKVPFLLAKPAPNDVDPEDWKYMSDEQKALFQ